MLVTAVAAGHLHRWAHQALGSSTQLKQGFAPRDRMGPKITQVQAQEKWEALGPC